MNEHERGQVIDSAAEIYEEFFVPALFAEWPARVLEAAQVGRGDSVLDVACGTGILARKAAELTGPGGTVVGVDVNEGMLAVAERLAPEIAWKKGPAESLPAAQAEFDRVVSQFGLMFFADRAAALKEMRRVLKPGGVMAVAVWGALEDTPGYAAVAEVLDELFGPQIAESIRAPYSLGDLERLRALFARAGIEDVELRTVTGKARFASIEAWIYTDIKGWTLAGSIDDEGYQVLRRYAPQKLSPFVQSDGTVAFDAPAHIVVARAAG